MGLAEARSFVEALGASSSAVGVESLDALSCRLEPAQLVPGAVLYTQGKVPLRAWAIRSGSVELASRLSGRRNVVQLMSEGSIVGDVPILLASPSLTTARVVAAGRALTIEAEALQLLVREDGAIAHVWMMSLAGRLDLARHRILQLLARDLRQSLARLILEQSTEGHVGLTQRELAEMLGVQRSSLNRAIAGLRREGLVEVSYRRIEILDERRLRLAADTGNEPPHS